jgi:hypothetical protein
MKLRILILFSLIAGLAFSFAGNANAQLPIETAIVKEQTVVGVESKRPMKCILRLATDEAIFEYRR